MNSSIILSILISLVYVRGSPVATDAENGSGWIANGICDFKCTKERMPICAVGVGKNNFQIFQNFCDLMLFNCKSKTELQKVDMEKCLNKNLKLEDPEQITSRITAV